MSAHHADPEYARNARAVRKAVTAALARGQFVGCQRCGRALLPDQRFDIGHRIDASRGGTHARTNLGPEHRKCNRSAGGRLGSTKTNLARGTDRTLKGLPSWL